MTPLTRDAPRATARARWLLPALAVLLAVAPAVFWSGGVIEEEALGFQRNFWGSRPVLQRIFETREFDDFQGRELSYAIDCLDAQWIRALLARGVFLFVAPSVLAASLALVPIGLWLLPAALPGLDRVHGWLVLLLYLGNFAVASTTALLYRATKPLVAPLLLALLLLLLAELRRPRLRRPVSFALFFALALAMSLLDRQGLFYVLVLLPLLGALWLRTRRQLVPLLALGLSVLCCLLYNERLGPWLIHRLNGYWPDRSFQQLDPRWLLAAGPWRDALALLGDWTRILLGGLPPPLLCAAAIGTLALWAWHARGRKQRVAFVIAAAAATVLVQTSMVALMVARYHTITWIDHRCWYYPLPYQALLVLGLLYALERWALARGALPHGVTIVLVALLIGNLAQWPERRTLMESGPWYSGVARRSAALVRSWQNGRSEPLLDGEYRRFYFESLSLLPRLAVRAGSHVAEGNGVGLAELRDGRLVAPVRREAHLPVTAVRAGRYVLVGGAVLQPGTTLSVLLGPRSLAELPADERHAGLVRFRLATELSAGPSDLTLLARRNRKGGDGRRDFLLRLPLLVWPDETAALDTIIF